MGNDWRPKNGARPFGITACAALLLTACAAPIAAPTVATALASPADPILQAVATAAPGSPVSVSTPAGPVTLTVISDYASAEGNECRGYTAASQSAPPVSKLACDQNGSWRDIPPLAPSDNESGVP